MADQVDRVADLADLGRERHRYRPRLPVGQAHVVDDRLPRLRALEALERREAAVGEELEVRGLLVGKLELAHEVAAAPTFSSTSAITFCADSSGDSLSVSTISSACSGSSYGSDTPVNSLISPLNAFS